MRSEPRTLYMEVNVFEVTPGVPDVLLKHALDEPRTLYPGDAYLFTYTLKCAVTRED